MERGTIEDDSMRALFILALFSIKCCGACLTNQWLITFENGTPNAAANTNQFTVKGQTTWTLSGSPQTSYFVVTSAPPIAPSYTLCIGGTVTPNSTTWLYSSATNNSSVHFNPWGAGAPPYDKMSIGCWMMHTFPDNDQSQNDFFMVKGSNNGIDDLDLANAKLSVYGDGLHKIISLEGCKGSDAGGSPIAFILKNTVYWVSVLYDQSVGHVVMVYDSNTNLLTTITQIGSCTQPTAKADYVLLGNSDNPFPPSVGYGFYMNNITVSSGPNPVWPLLPQSDPPPPVVVLPQTNGLAAGRYGAWTTQ